MTTEVVRRQETTKDGAGITLLLDPFTITGDMVGRVLRVEVLFKRKSMRGKRLSRSETYEALHMKGRQLTYGARLCVKDTMGEIIPVGDPVYGQLSEVSIVKEKRGAMR